MTDHANIEGKPAGAAHHHHHHHHAANATGFAALLRTGTQDLHDQAESGEFQRRMVEGELLREEFVAFLQQVLHVHQAIEPIMRESAAKEPRLGAMLLDSHYRVAKIEQDLADLGAAPLETKLGSTVKFIEFAQNAASTDPLSLVGVLYVKEGATNGNKIVAARIRKGLGLPETIAMGYLDPHGADQRRNWMAFKESLNNLDLTPEEEQRCLAAARATFELFMGLSAELAAQREVASQN